MPRNSFRLTGLEAASKLFFTASQRAFDGLLQTVRNRRKVKAHRIVRMATKPFVYRRLSALGLLIFAAILSPARAQSMTEPAREQLLNGLTILYSTRPGDPNVLMKLRVQSGAAFDLAGRAGTMALLGDALFPDPETREYVTEQLSGRLEISTNYDAIDVTISGKATELENMIQMLRNALVSTNLSVENVKRIREARIKELTSRPPSASGLADRAVAFRLFGTFPYANPPGGTIESLGKVERSDLLLAQERFLHADNATLVVIGGAEKSRLLRALRQLLGPWQKGDRKIPATFRQPTVPDAHVLLIEQPDAKSAEIRLAVRGLARSDPDAGAASLLAEVVRERWQTASPDLTSSFARHNAHALPGIFVLGATVPTATAGKAISAAQEVLRVLAQGGPSAAELERARAVLLADANKRAAQPDSLADSWLDSETYKLPLMGNQSAELSRITTADVQRVAARLFKDAPQALAVVGDPQQLKAALGTKLETRPVTPDVKTTSDPAKSTRKP